MEEENRYLIVYVCNDRDLINLDMQIVKAESLYNAAEYVPGHEIYFYDIIDFLMKIAFVLAMVTCFICALAYFIAMIYCLKGGCFTC